MIKIKQAYLNIEIQLNGGKSYIIYKFTFLGRDSVDGTTIPDGLESPGIEIRWGRDFP